MDFHQQTWDSLRLKGYTIGDIFVQSGVRPAGGQMYVVINDVAMSFQGSPKNEQARSREISVNESLRAGAWTNVSLEAVPPTELGFVRVKEMSHRSINLVGK